ncbi:MAG: hypothetical protein ISR58_14520 [Anaerolineales bacterium]|nr:hypothetical protein [Chloroflexota bacterium]MBL6982391.1 hypothetical protein [Anaerolineales bacterium]
MPNKSIDWFPVIVAIVVLFVATVPFIYALNAGGDEYVFGGLLLNPLDGFTYLAKMYQGWEGNWRNLMAYSADPGEGAYINLYYLFLGHVARVLDAPMVLVYHAARLLGSVAMLGMIWRFFGELFSDQRSQRLAFALGAFGSGMGWIMIPFGQITSDLWVAEIYPFLSAFTNPHFPLGLTLTLWLILPQDDGPIWWQVLRRILISVLISIVSPFGLVVVITVLVGHFVYVFFTNQAWKDLLILRKQFFRLLLISIAGAPLMLYYLWIAANDPIISVWNAQNLTLSPALWDLLISLSPALILAGVGVWAFVKMEPSVKKDQAQVVLIIWLILGLILVYIPFGLQRRFLTGLFVPLAGLAALGIEKLSLRRPKSHRFLVSVFFILVIPTNLVVLMAGFYGARTHDAKLYLSSGEAHALNWIVENTEPDALVLSSPDMGIFIPAFTGRRVIYGHPFETVYADREREFVENLFSDRFEITERQFMFAERGVEYVLCGPREQEISDCSEWELKVEFSDDQVLIFGLGN